MALIRIANFEGGGVRGIIQSILVDEIVKQTGKHLLAQFHLKAATSAGAINAASFATLVGEKEPLYTPQETISHFAGESVARIFKTTRLDTHLNLVRTQFSNQSKKQVFKEVFNDNIPGAEAFKAKHGHRNIMLSDIKDDLIIPAQYLGSKKVFLFNTEAAKKDPRQDFALYDVINAATAAQGYFTIPVIKNASGEKKYLMDGGLYASNPALVAFAEASRKFDRSHNYLVVSFGTGKTSDSRDPKKLADLPLYKWAASSHNYAMAGNADLAMKLLGWNNKFIELIEFDIDFAELEPGTRPSPSFTQAKPNNIDRLQNAAYKLLEKDDTKRKIERLATIFDQERASFEELKAPAEGRLKQALHKFKDKIKDTFNPHHYNNPGLTPEG